MTMPAIKYAKPSEGMKEDNNKSSSSMKGGGGGQASQKDRRFTFTWQLEEDRSMQGRMTSVKKVNQLIQGTRQQQQQLKGRSTA
jgi:transcription initiation factor IIF auxiliary subunit